MASLVSTLGFFAGTSGLTGSTTGSGLGAGGLITSCFF